MLVIFALENCHSNIYCHMSTKPISMRIKKGPTTIKSYTKTN